jgi:ParB family chromosome partitioning protein
MRKDTMRRPLGRGLDALIGSIETTTPSDGYPNGYDSQGATDGPSMQMIETDRIAANPLQPRRTFEPQPLEELAAAIRSQGIVEPLIVRPAGQGKFELIAGERRLRAAILAGLERVPVIVRELDDRGAFEMSLVENLLREDLNPIEEASAFRRLNREFSMTHEEIAARIGKSRTHVTNTIRLIELPAPVIEMVTCGQLTAGQVRPLLALESADEQIDQATKIAEGHLSARAVEELTAERRSPHSGRARATNSRSSVELDPNLRALANAIQRVLKRKVLVTPQRGRQPGRIELEFYGDNDLLALVRVLTAENVR